LARTKKLQKCKNQSLANVYEIRQCSVAVAGFWRKKFDWIPAGSGHIRPDPCRFGQIRPESSGSAPINGRIRSYLTGSQPFWPDPARAGRIQAILARFGRLSRNPAIFLLASGAGGRIPTPVGYRRPDVVELRRRLDSDD
jgi:hypothetical protein